MNHFENLESNKVFHFFEEISKIPRCSGNEKWHEKNSAEKNVSWICSY